MKYVEWSTDTDGKLTSETKSQSTYTAVAEGTTTWSTETTGGWYVVNSDVTISSRVSVSGAVKLILADGKTLTISGTYNETEEEFTSSGGITVQSGASLTIYGQS